MKRGFTIFLLGLFLLNVLGYYGIFLGLQFNNTKVLQARFDNDDYAHLQEVTIKVPITVPYQSDTREYVRVNGEFEHEGDVYKMVKQRLQRDTLYIVCVKDNTSKEINQALKDYVKTYTDKPSSEKSQTTVLQNLIKDYITTSTALQSINAGWNYDLPQGSKLNAYESVSIQFSNPPPQV